jgi:2-polyprenyl-3-methyl-5-hydroxy-6-metoxy-1,4-benzoquinol methylase
MSKSIQSTTIAGANSIAGATSSSDRFPETADIETSSDEYAARFAGPIGEWLLRVQEKATLKMLAPYPGATILDVGGGHGQLTSALIQNGYQVTVLGSDESCQKRVQAEVQQGLCQFQVGNVLALPYLDNAFDVVISYRFLAHVTQWQPFLSEMNRVAKTAIIVDYPTVRSFNAIAPLLFKVKKGVEQNTRPFICYQESDILHYLKTLGLTPSDRYGQFFWPMVLHRMLESPALSALLEGLVRPLGLSAWLGSPVILKSVKG